MAIPSGSNPLNASELSSAPISNASPADKPKKGTIVREATIGGKQYTLTVEYGNKKVDKKQIESDFKQLIAKTDALVKGLKLGTDHSETFTFRGSDVSMNDRKIGVFKSSGEFRANEKEFKKSDKLKDKKMEEVQKLVNEILLPKVKEKTSDDITLDQYDDHHTESVSDE